MVFLECKLEKFRVFNCRQFDSICQLVRLVVVREVELCLSDDDLLLVLFLHDHLELRLQ